MNSNKHYTKNDIENYWQGKMTAQEMRALELAALQDAFLADAIEGYRQMDSSTSSRNLAYIEQQILPQRKFKKMWINASVLKYAAAIILVASVGYIAFLTTKNNTTTVAQNTITTTEKTVEPTDTSTSTEIAKAENNIARTEAKNNDHPTLAKDNSPLKAQTIDNENANNMANSNANNAATPPTTIIIPEKAAIANADKKIETESVKEIAPTKEYNIAANDSKDVVVSAAQSRKQVAAKLSANEIVSIKGDNKPITQNTIAPQLGWQNYLQYANNNNATVSANNSTATQVAFNNNNNLKGKNVELEFDVDANGMPTNIAVSRSSNDSTLDTKAIELLKNGPKWTTAKDSSTKKQKIEVSF